MKGDMSVMGMEFEFTGTMAYSLPDRYKIEIDAEIMGMKLHVIQIVRGDSVKNTLMVGGMTIPVNGDAEKEELKLSLAQVAQLGRSIVLFPESYGTWNRKSSLQNAVGTQAFGQVDSQGM